MIYHIYINIRNQTTIWYLQDNTRYSFGVTDPANTDYANFKKEILADEAQLQDADGNVMADAKAYVASLP
jgi:hypothetical protein